MPCRCARRALWARVRERPRKEYRADGTSGVRVVDPAFEPRNVVPGMGFSPDKKLQARLITYPDAHRYRLNMNYDSLPVNKPQCPYYTYNKDGAMRFDGNGGQAVNYEPNSFGGPTQETADAKERLIGNIVSSLKQTPPRIQELQVQHFYRVDPAYGTGVAKGLGLDVEAVVGKKMATSAAD